MAIMNGYSEHAQEETMKFLFVQTAQQPGATWYIGLSTSTFNPDASGIAEPSGGAYTRKVIDKSYFDIPTSSGLGTSGVMNLVWLALVNNEKDKRKWTTHSELLEALHVPSARASRLNSHLNHLVKSEKIERQEIPAPERPAKALPFRYRPCRIM